jgi:hypothetical protein
MEAYLRDVLDFDHTLIYAIRRTASGRPLYSNFGVVREKTATGFQFEITTTDFDCFAEV